MLARVVERARRAKTVDQVVVATTADTSDDAVAAFCAGRGDPCQRGSQHDVLERYYQAARAYDAEVVVRITADCPFIDPGVIDETVNAFFGRSAISDQRQGFPCELRSRSRQSSVASPQSQLPFDFAANRLPPPWGRTYPIGLDVEVCTIAALERAWQEAEQPYHREHVMPYLYENEPVIDSLSMRVLPPPEDHRQAGVRRGFRVLLVNHDPDYGSLRWTVDTPEDLELARQVYTYFAGRDDFTWLEVLELFRHHPELAQINAMVSHKGYRDVDARREE
jgi:spore coat polysaccharide biosynthesis protein SpsF